MITKVLAHTNLPVPEIEPFATHQLAPSKARHKSSISFTHSASFNLLTLAGLKIATRPSLVVA